MRRRRDESLARRMGDVGVLRSAAPPERLLFGPRAVREGSRKGPEGPSLSSAPHQARPIVKGVSKRKPCPTVRASCTGRAGSNRGRGAAQEVAALTTSYPGAADGRGCNCVSVARRIRCTTLGTRELPSLSSYCLGGEVESGEESSPGRTKLSGPTPPSIDLGRQRGVIALRDCALQEPRGGAGCGASRMALP